MDRNNGRLLFQPDILLFFFCFLRLLSTERILVYREILSRKKIKWFSWTPNFPKMNCLSRYFLPLFFFVEKMAYFFTIEMKTFSFLSHYFLEKNLTMHNQGKFSSTHHSIFCYYMQMRCIKVRSNVVLIYAVNIFAA